MHSCMYTQEVEREEEEGTEQKEGGRWSEKREEGRKKGGREEEKRISLINKNTMGSEYVQMWINFILGQILVEGGPKAMSFKKRYV